jgi:hypothetical protein
MISSVKTYRIFCRDRAPKFSGFRDVKARDARAALETVRKVRRLGDMTGRATAAEYWHAVEWEGGRHGRAADARGQAWLDANT